MLTLVERDGGGEALEAGDRDADFELVGGAEGEASAVLDLRGLSDALGEPETDINDVALSELVLEGVVRGLHELAEEGEAKGDEVVLEEADTEAQALPDGVK